MTLHHDRTAFRLLNALDAEIDRLKLLVAEQALDTPLLKEVLGTCA
jgi:hypothetical protein